MVGRRWTFPIPGKKKNTLELGENKFLSWNEICPLWSEKKFEILVPIPILYIPNIWYVNAVTPPTYIQFGKVPSQHGTPIVPSLAGALTYDHLIPKALSRCIWNNRLEDTGAAPGELDDGFKSWKGLRESCYIHCVVQNVDVFLALWKSKRNVSVYVETVLFTDMLGKKYMSGELVEIFPSASGETLTGI